MDSWGKQVLPTKLDSSLGFAPSVYGSTDNFGFGSFGVPAVETCRALEPTPVYITKNSSFVSASSHLDLLRDLSAVFMKVPNVDHDLKGRKNKIKGILRCTSNLNSCPFVVKVFTHSQSEILVEFQNRGGCVVAFGNFYRYVLTELSQMCTTHVLRRASCQTPLESPMRNLAALPLPPELEDPAETEEKKRASMLALCQKLSEDASGNMVDMQREALRTLAKIITECDAMGGCPEGRKLFLSVLTNALLSQDGVVVEHACVILVKLCTTVAAREDVCTQLLSSLCSVLDSPGSLDNRASKRYVAEAFSLLSSQPQHARKLKEDQYHNTLKKYAVYHDCLLQQSIATTLQHIEAS